MAQITRIDRHRDIEVERALKLVDEMEFMHSRIADEHCLFGEGRTLDQKRKAYRTVKQDLIDAIIGLGNREKESSDGRI